MTNRRAVSTGTGEVKNIYACAPTPDRDTSSATGACSTRPACTYNSASNHSPWTVIGAASCGVSFSNRAFSVRSRASSASTATGISATQKTTDTHHGGDSQRNSASTPYLAGFP